MSEGGSYPGIDGIAPIRSTRNSATSAKNNQTNEGSLQIENQLVVVAKLGNPGETYEDFTAALPASDCRYAVFDFDFTTIENCQKSKIFFIAWALDIANVRKKMVYASSKDRFKRELDGIQVELQATNPNKMSLDVIKAHVV